MNTLNNVKLINVYQLFTSNSIQWFIFVQIQKKIQNVAIAILIGDLYTSDLFKTKKEYQFYLFVKNNC